MSDSNKILTDKFFKKFLEWFNENVYKFEKASTTEPGKYITDKIEEIKDTEIDDIFKEIYQ